MKRVQITHHDEVIERVPVGESPAVTLDLEDDAYIAQAALHPCYLKPRSKTVDWQLRATIVTPITAENV